MPASGPAQHPRFANADELMTHIRPLCKDPSNWQSIAELLKNNLELVDHIPDVHRMIGSAAMEIQDYPTAIKHFQRVLQYDTHSFEANYYIGVALFEQYDLHSAMKFLNQAVKLNPTHTTALEALARCLASMKRPEMSLSCYRTIESLNPQHPMLYNHIGVILDALGKQDEADESYEKAMNLNPENAYILFNMATRKRYPLDSDMARHITRIYQQCDQTVPSKDLMYLSYAMAALYDRNHDLPTAFTYYQQANQLQKTLTSFCMDTVEDWIQLLKSTFSADFIRSIPSDCGCPDPTPIFIVGMPRSGSTLTEQIIASHKRVSGADELELLRRMQIKDIPSITGKSYPQAVHHLQPQHFMALGEHYCKSLRTYADNEFIIDKMPHNFYHIGLIRLILPHAKIIHTQRDPIDTCWSLWRQCFFNTHNYKCDFDDLARAYRAYQDIMDYWQACFPNAIFTLRYEDLIENPRERIEALLTYCGLEWDDNCLNFHKTKRAVQTASLHQINQPLYQSALASWKPVETQLQPMIEALRRHRVIT